MCLDSEGLSPSQMMAVWSPRVCEMPVDAIPGDVEDAVLEPFDRNMAGREGGVLDLGERLHPVDPLALFGPEAVGIADRARIHFAVLGVIDPGALGPFGRYVVNLLGHSSPSTLAAREREALQVVFIVKTIMRSPGRRRQAEQLRPSAGLESCAGSNRATRRRRFDDSARPSGSRFRKGKTPQGRSARPPQR